MFVVFSAQQDDCAAQVYAELRSRGHDVLLIDDGLSTSQLELNWMSDANEAYGGWIGVNGRRAKFADVNGILLRMLNPLRPEPGQLPHDRQYVLIEFAAAVEGVINAFPGCVVNRPTPGLSGRNIYARRGAANLVTSCGFEVPDLFIDTETSRLRPRLLHAGYERAILAGLHAPIPPAIVATAELDDSIARVTQGAVTPPVYAVGLPDGELIDVYVAGDCTVAVFAAMGDRDARPARIELPDSAMSAARELAGALDLHFAQVSAVQTQDGFVCLGVNEFPIYSHCPADVQAEITVALVDALETPREALA